MSSGFEYRVVDGRRQLEAVEVLPVVIANKIAVEVTVGNYVLSSPAFFSRRLRWIMLMYLK